MSSKLVPLLALCAVACVRSTGFPDPVALSNTATIDGVDVVLERVTVEARADGAEFIDGKTARVVAGVGELTLLIELGPLDGEKRLLTPHGAPGITATDGPESREFYEALEGSVTVSEGDGAVGTRLVIELADVRFVHVCTGAEIVVTTAVIAGEVVEGDFSDAIVGRGGYVFIPEIVHPTQGTFSYLGIAEGTLFSDDGIDFFVAGTAEGCINDRPRPNFHLFTLAFHPPDFAAGPVIALATAPQSLVFVTETTPTGATVVQARAVAGTVEIGQPEVSLEDGALLTAEFTNLELRFRDADGEFTADPPITIPSISLRAVLGEPVIQ